MIFADFYKSPRSPLAKLRHPQPLTPNPRPQTPPSNRPDWSAEDHADLLSRDKTKVKDAVKRYLAAKVRNDWDFTWPAPTPKPTPTAHTPTPKEVAVEPSSSAPLSPESLPPQTTAEVQDELKDDAGYQNDDTDSDVLDEADQNQQGDNHDAISIYSVVSEDPTHYKALLEWDSDVQADSASVTANGHGYDDDSEPLSKVERQARKRRDLRKEMEYNEGLACFEARRTAWTQAKTVRVRVKPDVPAPVTPQHSPRRFFFRRSVSSSPSATQHNGQSLSIGSAASSTDGTPEKDGEKEHSKKDSTSQVSDHSDSGLHPVETIVPVPAPILPPQNILRASIQPSNYLQLYDKLIVNSLTPSCPINLSDMLPACVAGWKRDGEWPPRPALPVDPVFAAYGARKKKRASAGASDNPPSGRRMSLTGLLSRDKDGESRPGKGVRHSLQRALGLGHPVEVTVAKERTKT